jgi:hypothetical protein
MVCFELRNENILISLPGGSPVRGASLGSLHRWMSRVALNDGLFSTPDVPISADHWRSNGASGLRSPSYADPDGHE